MIARQSMPPMPASPASGSGSSGNRPHRSSFVDELLGLTTGSTDMLAVAAGQADTGPLAIGAPLDAAEESGTYGISLQTTTFLQEQLARDSSGSPLGGASPMAPGGVSPPEGVEALHHTSNSVLHSLAELHGAAYAAVALEARSLLVVRQQPSVMQKLRAIESALMVSASPPAAGGAGPEAAAALQQALVQTEQPVEDVLMWFFGHEDSRLRCNAVETYIRRLYRSYVIGGVSVTDRDAHAGGAVVVPGAPLQVAWHFVTSSSAGLSGNTNAGGGFYPVDAERGLPHTGTLIPSFDSVDDLQRLQRMGSAGAQRHASLGAGGLAGQSSQARAILSSSQSRGLAPVPEQSDIAPGMKRHGVLAVFADVAHVQAQLHGVMMSLAARVGGQALPGGQGAGGTDESDETAVNVVHIAVLAPPTYDDLEAARASAGGDVSRNRAGTEQSSVFSVSRPLQAAGAGGLTEAQTVELLTRISEPSHAAFAAAGVRRISFMVDRLLQLQGASQGTPTQDALMVTVEAVAQEAQRFRDAQEAAAGAGNKSGTGSEDEGEEEGSTPMWESVRILLPGSIVPPRPDPAVARARAVAGSEDEAGAHGSPLVAAGRHDAAAAAAAGELPLLQLARRTSTGEPATEPLPTREALLRLVFGRRSLVTAPGFPAVFTLRARKGFTEDSIVRHIEPPMSGFLELNRLENFRIRIIHTPNRSVHVYEAVAHRDEAASKAAAKAGKRASRPRKRYFVRGIVRHTERLSSAESAASMFPGPERVFVEALNALAISIGERALADTSNPVGNNHIFLNVVPVASITPEFVEMVIQKLARLYAKKLRHLRVSTVEFKISLQSQPGGPCTPVRLVASNPTGYVLRVDQYAEVPVALSTKGESVFRLIGSTRSGAARPGAHTGGSGSSGGRGGREADDDFSPGLGLGAPGTGMLAAVGAVPSAGVGRPLGGVPPSVGGATGPLSAAAVAAAAASTTTTAEYENWDGKPTTAPYPDESIFESKRALAAAASETVYCWDFIELFQRALEVSWDKYQQGTRGVRDPHPRPRQMLQVTELALVPKRRVQAAAAAAAAALQGAGRSRPGPGGIYRSDSYATDMYSSELGPSRPSSSSALGQLPHSQQQSQRLLENDGLAHRRSFGNGNDNSSDTASEPSENKGEWTTVGRRRGADDDGTSGKAASGSAEGGKGTDAAAQPAAADGTAGSSQEFPPGASFEEQFELVERDPLPGQNRIGMVAWRLRMYTPEFPERAGGREIVVIANDITVRAGSFGTKEDALFDLASKRARALGLPRIYMAANSGARIGLADEVKKRFRVAWNDPSDPTKGFKYLYLTESDHAVLGPRGSVRSRKVVDPVTGEVHHELLDIIGCQPDIGVENLRGSATIAGETSRAYKDVFTLTYVTGRSVGIGAYLVRLGQRTIQKAGAAPILLTGFHALNTLIGRRVYTSNQQLGGPRIMHTNGVSHLVVEHDLQGVAAILRWLAYVPARAGGPLPDGSTAAAADPVDRDVQYRPPADGPFDPRHLLVGAQAQPPPSSSSAVAQDSGPGPGPGPGPDAILSMSSSGSLHAGAAQPQPQHLGGLFDDGSFMETLQQWARSVIVGRARLGGIPVGVIVAETRSVTSVVPADPAAPESHEQRLQQAGNVWFPDSAYKTSQAIRDFNGEGLPLVILANWRGFSGGQRDMFHEILKFGSYIVDALVDYKQPVIVYIPPRSELRGGAWVVVDPTINPDVMEMYAAEDARGGILEPAGAVSIKFRERDVRATVRRCDGPLAAVQSQVTAALESGDAPLAKQLQDRAALRE